MQHHELSNLWHGLPQSKQRDVGDKKTPGNLAGRGEVGEADRVGVSDLLLQLLGDLATAFAG
jgi:hypothetical protein